MTPQEIFDTVVDHLLSQGKKSSVDVCMYRTSTGLKCAVGILISDSDYDSDMEFSAVDSLYSSQPIGIQEWAQQKYPHDLKLLTRLQRLHDNGPSHSFNNPHDAWEEYILTESQIIAKEFNLTWKRTP